MTDQPNLNPASDEQLREKLWEYVYELLPADEMAEWTQRITSDPHIARLYAEVKLQAGRIAEALVHHGPCVPLRTPEPISFESPAALDASTAAALPGTSPNRTPRGRLPRMVANLLAVAATLLIAAGWWVIHFRNATFQPTDAPPSTVIPLTRLIVPSSTAVDLPVRVVIETRDAIDNRPVSSEVTITAGEGPRQWKETYRTDDRGFVHVLVPAEHVQVGEMLTVIPAGKEALAVQAPLPQPLHNHVAHILTDRLVYHPGETVRFRAVILDAISMEPMHPSKVSFRIVNDITGKQYPDSVVEMQTDSGVATGEYRLPSMEDNKNDSTTFFVPHSLILESADGEFPAVRRRFFVRPAEPASWGIDLELGRDSFRPNETLKLDVALVGKVPENEPVEVWVRFATRSTVFQEERLNLAANQAAVVQWQTPQEWPPEPIFVEAIATVAGQRAYRVVHVPRADARPIIRLFPEGGEIVPGLPNRVYFEVQDELGLPAKFRGELIDDEGQKVLEVATHPAVPGRGVWTWTPLAGNRYQIKDLGSSNSWHITIPGDPTDHAAVLRIEPGAVQGTEPLRATVYAKKQRVPMLIVVSRMNVPVAQASFTTSDKSPLEPVEVELEIPQPVSGVLRVTLFDLSGQEARAVAERLAYRSPASVAQIQPQNLQDPVAQRPWQANFSVVDQRSQPIEGIAGVVIQPQDDSFASTASLLADALLAGDCPLLFEDEPLEVYFDNGSQTHGNRSLTNESIDLLLGTRGWRKIHQPADGFVALRILAGGLVATEAVGGVSTADGTVRGEDLASARRRAAPAKAEDGQPESADEIVEFFSSFATTPVEPPAQWSNFTAVNQWTHLGEPPPSAMNDASPAVLSIPLMIASLIVFIVVMVAGWMRYVSWAVWIPSLAVAGLVLIAQVANVPTLGKKLLWKRHGDQTELAMAPKASPPSQAESSAERATEARQVDATAPPQPTLAEQLQEDVAAGVSLHSGQSLSQQLQALAPPSEAVTGAPALPAQMRQNGPRSGGQLAVPVGADTRANAALSEVQKGSKTQLVPVDAEGRATPPAQPRSVADAAERIRKLPVDDLAPSAPPAPGIGGRGGGAAGIPESQSRNRDALPRGVERAMADRPTGSLPQRQEAARRKGEQEESKPEDAQAARDVLPQVDTHRGYQLTPVQTLPAFQYVALRHQLFDQLHRMGEWTSLPGQLVLSPLSDVGIAEGVLDRWRSLAASGIKRSQRAALASVYQDKSPATRQPPVFGTLSDTSYRRASDVGLWEPLCPVRDGRLSFTWPAPQDTTPHLVKIMVHGGGVLGELHWPVHPAPPVTLHLEPSPTKAPLFSETDQWQWPILVTNRSRQKLRLTSLAMIGGGKIEFAPSSVEVADQETLRVDVSAAISLADATAPLRIIRQEPLYREEPDTSQGVWTAELCWKFEPNEYLIRNVIGVTPHGYPRWVQRFDTEGTHRVLECSMTPPGSRWRVATVRVYPSWAAEVIDTVRWLARQAPKPPLAPWIAARTLKWLEHENVPAPVEKRLLKTWLKTEWPEGPTGYSSHERMWLTLERMALQTGGQPTSDTTSEATDQSDIPLVLAARMAVLRGDPHARELLQKLVEQQLPSGAIAAAAWPENISASGDEDRQASLEATAVAVLAWSEGPGQDQFTQPRDRALRWLRQQRQADGGFGSAYGSALTLLALLSQSNGASHEQRMHHASCQLDGEKIEELKFYEGSFEPVVRHIVTPSAPWQKWELVFLGEEDISCASEMGICLWTDEKPATASPYQLEVTLESAQATVGGRGDLLVRLRGEAASPAVVHLGIPAGLEPDLRDLPLNAQMDGQYLQLRFDSPFRQPEAWVRSADMLEFRVPVRFLWAGQFTGPPSYVVPERGSTFERRFWVEPLRIDISH